MTLFLVRHGETIENKQMILQGHLPGHLTQTGKDQIATTANNLLKYNVQFNCIISSDLKRAIDSAQIISKTIPLTIYPTPLLRERNWGPFTGMTIEMASKKFKINGKWQFPQKGDNYQFDENERINSILFGKYAESEKEIYERAKASLKKIKNMYHGDNIIIVTHGQFARNMIAAHFNCSYQEISPIFNGEIRKLII